MRDLIFIAAAGALGATARYGVGVGAARLLGPHFAWGTLIVNVVGCFVLAAFLTWGVAANEAIPNSVKLAIGTGFLGAFTTFSTFGYETLVFVDRGQMHLAAANVFANLVLGLGASWAGFAIGRVALERAA